MTQFFYEQPKIRHYTELNNKIIFKTTQIIKDYHPTATTTIDKILI